MQDLFVLIPGIMGSELRRGKKVQWGLDRKLWGKALLPFVKPFADLAIEDKPGEPPVVATDLLRFPISLPGLTSVEPYTDLENRLRALAGDERFYMAFPYDWRLSIATAATRLESAIEQRLNTLPSPEDVRVTLVCHSMGGLVARYFIEVNGAHDLVRNYITLGTPFSGSLKALHVLATGEAIRVGPLSFFKGSIRDAAATMPGLHELVARHPCVETWERGDVFDESEHSASKDPPPMQEQRPAMSSLRPLTLDERVEMGATEGLVESAEETFVKIEEKIRQRGRAFDRHRPLVGSAQPTYARIKKHAGSFELVRAPSGDGTVPETSASPKHTNPAFYPQRHGALAKTTEVLTAVEAIDREEVLGRPLGDEIGMDVPDAAVVGTEFLVESVSRRGAVTRRPGLQRVDG